METLESSRELPVLVSGFETALWYGSELWAVSKVDACRIDALTSVV